MTFKRITGIGVICGLIVVLCHAQSDTFFSEWRPNADTRGIRFVGNKVCADCHPKEATQLTTPMAQALEVAPDCKIVTARGKLTFRNGPYSYEISRQGQSVIYTVSDGAKSITKPILYCFGQGHVGQTYLFRHNDILYETRVSFFQKPGAWISRLVINLLCRRRSMMHWAAQLAARNRASVLGATLPVRLTDWS